MNDWLVLSQLTVIENGNQYTVIEGQKNRRPDVVLYTSTACPWP